MNYFGQISDPQLGSDISRLLLASGPDYSDVTKDQEFQSGCSEEGCVVV